MLWDMIRGIECLYWFYNKALHCRKL